MNTRLDGKLRKTINFSRYRERLCVRSDQMLAKVVANDVDKGKDSNNSFANKLLHKIAVTMVDVIQEH